MHLPELSFQGGLLTLPRSVSGILLCRRLSCRTSLCVSPPGRGVVHWPSQTSESQTTTSPPPFHSPA